MGGGEKGCEGENRGTPHQLTEPLGRYCFKNTIILLGNINVGVISERRISSIGLMG